ncbi:MAG: hypothetical protein GVY16_12335 [Planctomycetes bacterium]|nr:zinc-dependent peptidase [Phycisphaerae bacterium]NBB96509.1 hypothetical protein [Planctomycetota bacterium]
MQVEHCLVAAAVIVLGVPALVYLARRGQRDRRQTLMHDPWPERWETIAKRNVELFNRLPDDLRQRLRGYVQVFLAEKNFEGCGGLALTEEMCVTIAVQACMLLLGHPRTRFYRKLRSVLVYPSDFVARQRQPLGNSGLIVDGPVDLLGQASETGTVVLAWDHARHGAAEVADGHNVVLHEFAHQLDMEAGPADGAPALARPSEAIDWARVMQAEFDDLQQRIEARQRHDIDAYGATNPAEFFAVTTEVFFEQPDQLSRRHPDLYEQFRNYYQLDPRAW